ncbi:hypothetical protein BDEG_22677 [Batrachochytrium dendrobatidis JEL423]|uniref:HMG box domain-containing protein n=1 Tax=Batrachochytrium dendrobatidis (strain JEL423) TaxID=403673 RepID=A0A177WHE9_BATDL|nr:hypothetical protein BDEG_22677 [Batrachochytrium dendrobatidis JEL423]
MPPKNSKAAAALEKKAVAQAGKNAQKQANIEAIEAQSWKTGAKDSTSKMTEEAKRQEALAKKAERQAILDAEEAAISFKPKKGDAKKPPARTGNLDAFLGTTPDVDSYAASGIDNAMELLNLASKSGSASNNDKVERHAEKRVKSAYAVFEERELPIIKAENPTLRLSQIKQALQKKWKKSPENPLRGRKEYSFGQS